MTGPSLSHRSRAVLGVLAVLAPAWLGLATASASGPMESFVLVEKVTFEPNAEKPERIRIEGAFAVADGEGGWRYLGARWGVAYFSIVEGSEDACRAEWKDVERAAANREIVGFGEGRRRPPFPVFDLGAKVGEPHPYPVGGGISRARGADFGPVRQLSAFPRPLEPVGSTAAGRRSLELVARNVKTSREGTKYLFEVETANGERQASPAIEPGADGTTRWKVPVTLKENEILTWRVRVLQEGLDPAPVAVARVEVARRDR